MAPNLPDDVQVDIMKVKKQTNNLITKNQKKKKKKKIMFSIHLKKLCSLNSFLPANEDSLLLENLSNLTQAKNKESS